MTDQTQFLLNQAAAAIKAGDLVGGRKLLESVLETDPDNESAWLWMSAAVESDDERRHCLQQILRINPDSAQARLGLEKLGPAPGGAEELSEPTPAAPGSEMEAFNNMMADFAAFDAAKEGSGVQASGPDVAAGNDVPAGNEIPAGNEFPAFTWPLEPEQRDLAPDKLAAPGSESEQVDLEALFKSFDAASGKAAEPSSAGEKAFEWDFNQPSEGGQPAAPAEQLSGEEALDRFLGVEPPKADVRGFYEDDAKAGKVVPAFTFDEQDEIAAAEGGSHALTGETSGSAAFVSPPLPDTDFSFDIDRITSDKPVETQGDSSRLASLQKAEGLLQLWANPGGKANSVVILRDEFLVLANPDALFFDRIREEVERGEVKKKSLGRTAKAIAIKSILRVQGEPESSGFTVVYARGKEKLLVNAEFESPQVRDQALDALAEQLGLGFKKVEENASRSKLILLPVVVLVIACLGAPLLAYLSTLLLGMPQSLADLSFALILPLVIGIAGFCVFVGGLIMLFSRLRQPLSLVALVPADELGL